MLATTWVGVLGTVVLLSSIVAGGAAAQPASCAKPAHLPAGSRDSKHRLLLTAREGDAIAINFDDSRSRQAYPILLSANAGQLLPSDFGSSSGLQAGAGDYYISRDGQHRISVNTGDQMRALLIPINPHVLQLCVIVQPNADGGVEPGRYKGTILIAHNGNQELLSVPIELTFRASHWTGIEIALVAVLLGLLVKVLSEAAARQRQEKTGAMRALKSYASELSFPVTLILAAIAGWFVFDQMYAGNPIWGSSGGDITKLFAVCFVAQMSSNQGIDVIRNMAGGAFSSPPPATANAG
ncbi:MAG TPA: hypothetical protein VGH35_03555 [Gaiellaceae bacterium]